MVPIVGLGIASILGNVFTNLWGANKASKTAEKTSDMQIKAATRAAELEKQALDEALAYQKEIDARDYGDWLKYDERERRDWENKELRRQPYRALGDSAVRTLADYIAVPGMRAAQEVPVQIWQPQAPMNPMTASQGPVSSTMPVGSRTRVAPESNYTTLQGMLPGYQQASAQDPTLLSKYSKRVPTIRDLMEI